MHMNSNSIISSDDPRSTKRPATNSRRPLMGWKARRGGPVRKRRLAAAVAVADTKALGDKLASGATWAREEVAKGFEALGNASNALGQKIGSSKKAAPVNVGS